MDVSISPMGLCLLQSTDHPHPRLRLTGLSDLFSWSVHDAITNYHGLSGLNNKRFSQFWRLGSTRWRCQQIQCLARAPFLICRWPFSPCILTWWRAEREKALLSLLIRALIPFMRAPPAWPNYLLKTPPPNTIISGVRISTYEFGGDKNIQSIIPVPLGVYSRNKCILILNLRGIWAGGGGKHIWYLAC